MQKSHENLHKEAEECLKSDPILENWLKKIPLPKWPFQNYMSEHLDSEESLWIYFALLRAIASQQLSSSAAKAILAKMTKMGDGHLPRPENLLMLEDESLRSCGLSRQKVKSLKEVAQRAVQNMLPTPQEALEMDSVTLRQILIKIPGIGDWSADMVMIFALHHPDILAVGDYGVREGYRLIYQLEKQPTPKALVKVSKRFSPYCSLLTGYCWAVKEFMQKHSDLT